MSTSEGDLPKKPSFSKTKFPKVMFSDTYDLSSILARHRRWKEEEMEMEMEMTNGEEEMEMLSPTQKLTSFPKITSEEMIDHNVNQRPRPRVMRHGGNRKRGKGLGRYNPNMLKSVPVNGKVKSFRRRSASTPKTRPAKKKEEEKFVKVEKFGLLNYENSSSSICSVLQVLFRTERFMKFIRSLVKKNSNLGGKAVGLVKVMCSLCSSSLKSRRGRRSAMFQMLDFLLRAKLVRNFGTEESCGSLMSRFLDLLKPEEFKWKTRFVLLCVCHTISELGESMRYCLRSAKYEKDVQGFEYKMKKMCPGMCDNNTCVYQKSRKIRKEEIVDAPYYLVLCFGKDGTIPVKVNESIKVFTKNGFVAYSVKNVIIHQHLLNHYYAICKNGGKWTKYDDEDFRVLRSFKDVWGHCSSRPSSQRAALVMYEKIGIEDFPKKVGKRKKVISTISTMNDLTKGKSFQESKNHGEKENQGVQEKKKQPNEVVKKGKENQIIEKNIFETSSSAQKRQRSAEELLLAPRKKMRVTGLRNLGNTCYVNSSLQILINNEKFVLFLLRSLKKKRREEILLEKNGEDRIKVTELLFIMSLSQKEKRMEFLREFIKFGIEKKWILRGKMQDSFVLLSKLAGLLKPDILLSKFRTYLHCPICNKISCLKNHEGKDYFTDYIRVIKCQSEINGFENVSVRCPGICEVCGDRSVRKRKFEKIEKVPEVLLLKLDRGKNTLTVPVKINQVISINTVSGVVKCDLVGVIVHKGTFEAAHYFSFFKTVLKTGRWTMFNDSSAVTGLSFVDVSTYNEECTYIYRCMVAVYQKRKGLIATTQSLFVGGNKGVRKNDGSSSTKQKQQKTEKSLPRTDTVVEQSPNSNISNVVGTKTKGKTLEAHPEVSDVTRNPVESGQVNPRDNERKESGKKVPKEKAMLQSSPKEKISNFGPIKQIAEIRKKVKDIEEATIQPSSPEVDQSNVVEKKDPNTVRIIQSSPKQGKETISNVKSTIKKKVHGSMWIPIPVITRNNYYESILQLLVCSQMLMKEIFIQKEEENSNEEKAKKWFSTLLVGLSITQESEEMLNLVKQILKFSEKKDWMKSGRFLHRLLLFLHPQIMKWRIVNEQRCLCCDNKTEKDVEVFGKVAKIGMTPGDHLEGFEHRCSFVSNVKCSNANCHQKEGTTMFQTVMRIPTLPKVALLSLTYGKDSSLPFQFQETLKISSKVFLHIGFMIQKGKSFSTICRIRGKWVHFDFDGKKNITKELSFSEVKPMVNGSQKTGRAVLAILERKETGCGKSKKPKSKDTVQ